jgi:hypothetical protein
MAMFHLEQDKKLVYMIFMTKLAEKKGIDREKLKQNPNWLMQIHFMEMPLLVVMVSKTEWKNANKFIKAKYTIVIYIFE